MTGPELLPCPFCGRAPRLAVDRGVTGLACRTNWLRATVECKCGVRGKTATTRAKAVSAWNRRAPSIFADFVDQQEPLGRQFGAALADKIEELYEP